MLACYFRRAFGYKLMLSDLPLGASISETNRFFSELSLPYNSIIIPELGQTRSVKGYAVMNFSKKEDCKAANEKMKDVCFMGKRLKVLMLKRIEDQRSLNKPLLKHRDANE